MLYLTYLKRKGIFPLKYREVIEKANSVPLWQILKLPQPKKSKQIKCPFSERHSHGDASKSARYYVDTNRIFCHMEQKGWGPVDLIAEKGNVSRYEAAKAILKKFGGAGSRIDRVEWELKKFKKFEENEQERRYKVLEEMFNDPGICRFIFEQSQIAIEYKVDLFEETLSTAMAINELIKERSGANESQDKERSGRDSSGISETCNL